VGGGFGIQILHNNIDPRGYSLNFELPAVIINKKKKGILSSRSIYNNPIIRAGAKINLIT